MLKTLSEAFGASGAEQEVRDYIKNAVESICDDVYTDNMGNLICFKKGKLKGGRSIMLSAHMDEVGFIISGINEKGYLNFKTIGGIDPRVVIAKRVLIGKNKIRGVIGDKPPHLTDKNNNAALKTEELFIDIGAKNKQEAGEYVSIGDYACFDSKFIQFGNGLVKGKALDNRIGCYILTELAKNNYPHDIFYVFTVQEEVCCRGAQTAAYKIKPDISIVVEGTTCSDVPKTDETGFSTRLRGGPALSIVDRTSYSDKELRNALYKAAIGNNIKIQYKQTTLGGNDAGAIQLSEAGVKTAVISVPCRYIHSPSSVASLEDISACREVLHNFLISEDKEKWSF